MAEMTQQEAKLRISKSAIAWMTRRHWARLWGQKHMIKPVFIKQHFGDGGKLVAITPLNTRPNYYLIRADSSWSMYNGDTPCLADHLDDIYDAIEDVVGRKYETDDDNKEAVRSWPAFDDECGTSWSDAMDLLADADRKEKENNG